MIKLRNTLLILIILLLTSCSPEGTGGLITDIFTNLAHTPQSVVTESSLKQALSEKTNLPVCAFFFIEGLEGGDASAFAFTGELSQDVSGDSFEGALWYVDAQDCILLKDNIETIRFEPTMIENGHHLLFCINSGLPNGSHSYIWAVTEQKPELLFETADSCFVDNGLLAMVKTSISNSAGGRTWQRYYLYWDQDKQSYEVYMGREITRDEFLSYENAWEARDKVESVLKEAIKKNYYNDDNFYISDTKYKYIQCDNGIIYVNYVMSYHSDVYYNYAIMRERDGTVFLEEREHYDLYEKGNMYANDDFYITDNWDGHYSHGGYILEGGYVDFDLIVYSGNGNYSGYLNLEGKEKAEGEDVYFEVQDRILVDIIDNIDEVHVYFKERIVENTKRGEIFGHFQSGDLLFSLKKDSEDIITTWHELQYNEKETRPKRGFYKCDESGALSLKLLSEKDKQQYLEAVKITMQTQPFYQYFDDDGDLQLELYYNMTQHKGIGIFYDRYQEQLTMEAFDVGSWVTGEWSDDKFSLTDDEENEYHFDNYNEEYIYNEQGQLTYFCSTGMVPGWKVPIMGELIKMEFTYREDGTLQKKASSFNPRAFWGSRSGTSYYDEQERLKYATHYITHGHLEDYYIYEDGSQIPSYCLVLDHGPGYVSAEYLVKYVE